MVNVYCLLSDFVSLTVGILLQDPNETQIYTYVHIYVHNAVSSVDIGYMLRPG